jgi:hypothetical protein
MRVLTAAELDTFKKAYGHVQRVSVAEADSVGEIMAGGERLPHAYTDLVLEYSGLAGLRGACCPLNYDSGLQRFIKYCFHNRIQPHAFMFKGQLSVSHNKPYTVAETYVARGGS